MLIICLIVENMLGVQTNLLNFVSLTKSRNNNIKKVQDKVITLCLNILPYSQKPNRTEEIP